jgi:transcriptional regulator with XRE-family HTH domain
MSRGGGVDTSGMPDSESPLGVFIRRQRELQALSMRQLADLVGISSPYLSQIEHGLREPSERVLEAIAENLKLSAEALRAHTGSDRDDGEEPAVVGAISPHPPHKPPPRPARVEIKQ